MRVIRRTVFSGYNPRIIRGKKWGLKNSLIRVIHRNFEHDFKFNYWEKF
jgi:hypothetical protein